MEQKKYRLEYRDNGVFLLISPFPGSLQEKINEVFQYINRKQVKDYDVEAIVEAIRSDQEQRVKIAESQEEKLIDESVNVYISEDAMEAYIEAFAC